MSSTKRQKTANDEPMFTPSVAAFENSDFLHSREARFIRIMCEYEETLARLRKYKIKGTLLFFGSARSNYREEHDKAKAALEQDKLNNSVSEQLYLEKQERLQATEWMCDVCPQIEALAEKLTSWSTTQKIKLALGHMQSRVEQPHALDEVDLQEELGPGFPQSSMNPPAQGAVNAHLVVSTGGGRGFMEAANRGARAIPDAQSMGCMIRLPFEEKMNPSVSPELSFEYHYFFSRKFWLLYQCRALIVAPGGYGTLDELFEVLTLKSTKKFTRDIPIVLYDATYWQTIINWSALIRYGVISKSDYDMLYFASSVDDAYTYITKHLANVFEQE